MTTRTTRRTTFIELAVLVVVIILVFHILSSLKPMDQKLRISLKFWKRRNKTFLKLSGRWFTTEAPMEREDVGDQEEMEGDQVELALSVLITFLETEILNALDMTTMLAMVMEPIGGKS